MRGRSSDVRRKPRTRRFFALACLCAAPLIAAGPAAASDPSASVTQTPAAVSQTPTISDVTSQAALDSNIQRPLFGNLAWRRALEARGVQLIAHYVSESAANDNGVRGGGFAYAQQLDFGASFDLGKLGVWQGAVARLAVSDRVGGNLAALRTGGDFSYQEIYGQGQNFRIDEISIEKTFATMALKIGFYPLGNDFAGMPYVCNFQNVGICGHAQSLPSNSGWSDGPAGRWGARLRWHVSKAVSAQVGVFDVNPLVTLPSGGFKLDFAGSTGVIVPVEIAYQIGKKPSDYGGTYKIGAYYDTSTVKEVGDSQRSVAGRYGFYLEAAQQVFKTGPGRLQGLALFAIYTWGDEASARYTDYFEAGAAYRGLIPGRPIDLFSVGWVQGDFNPRLSDAQRRSGQPVQTSDEIVEVNYGFQVLPSLTLRPGLQYDFRPGGLSTRSGVLVGELQVKLTL